jgi:acetolactate synthase-1/3 small subunit
MKKELYTITVHTENKLGLLNRLSSIFLKKRINISELVITNSEVDNLAIFTFKVIITKETANNITNQIIKQIDVINASFRIANPKAHLKTESNTVLMHK